MKIKPAGDARTSLSSDVRSSTARGAQFDVDIERTVTADDLDWPWGVAAERDDVGCNREYWRLPSIGWGRVAKIIEQERQVIDRLCASPDFRSAHHDWPLKRENGEAEALIGLELGVNAPVAALKAARCFPFYSCNGGAFGGQHYEEYPAIAFYCRAELLPFIVEAAEEADVGLVPSHRVGVAAYARNVDALIDMAAALHRRRNSMAEVRLSRMSKKASGAKAFLDKLDADRQLNLL